MIDAYQQCRERADGKVCCDYSLHVTITHWNEQVAKEMEILVKEKGSFFFSENLLRKNYKIEFFFQTK